MRQKESKLIQNIFSILKITKSTANKIAMINKKSLHTKRASMGWQKLDWTEPEEKTYIVSWKEYVKKRKFDKRDFLINVIIYIIYLYGC